MKKIMFNVLGLLILSAQTVMYAEIEQGSVIDQPASIIDQTAEKSLILDIARQRALDALEPAVQHSTPFLVPFNKALFDRYCTATIARSETTESHHTGKLASASLQLSLHGVPLLAGFVNSCWACVSKGIAAHAGDVWKSTKNSLDFSSKSAGFWTLCKGAGLIWTAGMLYFCAHACKTHIQELSAKDFEQEQQEWREKKLLPRTEQELLWHTLVYEKFGKPTVSGDMAGRYNIVFQKTYGAGRVSFDPQNIEQVEILLGIHAKKHDDLRCDHIDIVPIIE
jgi:hypothetical protein